MTNIDLQAQFKKCEEWKDADQWDTLGMLYFNRGYVLNAGVCFNRADACRDQTFTGGEVLHVCTDLGMGGNEIDLTLIPVAVETGERDDYHHSQYMEPEVQEA